MIQWLGLQAFTAKGSGSTPGWGTKIHKLRCVAKKKRAKDKLEANTGNIYTKELISII